MKRKYCPCGGEVHLEQSINFFVCKRCCEMLYLTELVRACDVEFGVDHTHNNAECSRMLDEMSDASVIAYMEGERDAYNREAEAQMLGRPLLPNEY